MKRILDALINNFKKGMETMFKKMVTGILVFFFCAGVAGAADQDRKRTRSPKKDGSCLEMIMRQPGHSDPTLLSKDQTRQQKRDRKKDGSCQI